MGNQCCQSNSTSQEDRDQIHSSSSEKINKSSKNRKQPEIDDKIDNYNKKNSGQGKECVYQSAEQEEQPTSNDINNNQQVNAHEKSKSIHDQQESEKPNPPQKIPTQQSGKISKQEENNQQNGIQKQETDKNKKLQQQQEEQKQNEIQQQKEKQQKEEVEKANQKQKEIQESKKEQKDAKSVKGEKSEREGRDKEKTSKHNTNKSQSKDNKRTNKPKQSLKEFSVSADIFIHLKQGNISDEYKIGETLGEGAFGHVSKVTHKQTGLNRAMKCIKKSTLIKEEEQKMFSEMNILKNLDHPNIVRLYELYQDQKCYYLITEYCSGGELFDKIKSLTHFTERMAAEYMKQLLSAIFYCHQNKIVHRDLKPENLILESDKKGAPLKVIDFGTSRKFDSNKKMTKRLGTPYYIAPEVLGQKYDEKCDVWSCGVILYILLCGYPPFGGRTEEEILKKVKQGKVRFDPEDWDKMSGESKTLIKKMLTLDPKKRITTEQALNDPWVQKNAPQLSISSKALNSLAQFYTKSKLKQTIMTFIVSQLVSREEKDELQKTFRQLDKNGDGRLSKQELIEGYYKVYGDKEQAVQHVDRIMKLVDTNNSGVVDFTEFLMAAMQREQMLSKQKIEAAFKLFDQDGNGFITREELQTIIGEIDDSFWKQILLECDTNKDGKISQGEFIDLLIKKKL